MRNASEMGNDYGRNEAMLRALPPSPHVIALGSARAASLLWRMEGTLYLSVIVKASFELSAEGAMRLVQPEEIRDAEAWFEEEGATRVLATHDRVPYLPRADLLLSGHAATPEGAPRMTLPVRFALFRDKALFDKVIYVRGDSRGGKIMPFSRMPLVYERAYGGPSFEDNPLGTGVEPGSAPPNLVHPQDPHKVACFAAIGESFPLRRRLLGSLPPPLQEIPAGFDWGYFNAAPLDQQIDYLQGDEWVVLDGLSASTPHLQSYLPHARAVVRLLGLDAGASEGHILPMVADRLSVDADRMRCSLVWRGSQAVQREQEGLLEKAQVIARVLCDAPALGASTRPAPQAVPVAKPIAYVRIQDERETTLRLEEQKMGTTQPLENKAPKEALPFRAPLPAPSGTAAANGGTAAANGGTAAANGGTAAANGGTAAANEGLRPYAPDGRYPVSAPASAPVSASAPASASAPVSASVSAPAPVRELRRECGIAIVNETTMALGIVVWENDPPRDCLTIIAKATCAIVPGGPATLAAESEPLQEDCFAEDPGRTGCVYPSDFARYKVRADVVLTGNAYGPEVRFSFDTKQNGFERTILVFGPRHWIEGPAGPKPSEPEPFEQIPLRHEYAFGGPRFADNPIGKGLFDPMRALGHPAPLPELEDPRARIRTPRQKVPPACFGPIPLAWKSRIPRRPKAGVPWPFLPEDFDWTYYQAAPPGQQLAFLRGDEPFAIAGAHPLHPLLEGTLPGLRARAFTLASDELVSEVPLHLDTVIFELERMRLTLVFRGILTVPDEAAPGIERLLLVREPVGGKGLSIIGARTKLLQTDTSIVSPP